MAGLYHISSSNANPQHDMCPKGKDSWCGWQKIMAQNKSYKHKSYIPAAVMEEVLPIYKDLSKKDLLSRCLESFTQNANESLNNLIWARCPKKIYQGKKVVKLCTASAITHLNDGVSSVARVLERLQMPRKEHSMTNSKCDKMRINLANKKSSEKLKKRRKQLRAIKKDFGIQKRKRKATCTRLEATNTFFRNSVFSFFSICVK